MFDQSSSEGVTIDKFSLLSVIGKGSYAKVLLVRKKDSNKLYANSLDLDATHHRF